jgi:hypothetical protein
LGSGSVDILPRGGPARAALEQARAMSQVLGAQPLPPLLVGLPGAVCDNVLAAMREAGEVSFAAVTLGDAAAFHGEADADCWSWLPPVMSEFVKEFSGAAGAGGIALAGLSTGFPSQGVADLAAAFAGSASGAALAVASIVEATQWGRARADRRRIPDPLVAQAFKGRTLAVQPGAMPVDEIWEVLSKGSRRASILRERRFMQAAALALKGRGRTSGPVDGNRLLRFGVSEWR